MLNNNLDKAGGAAVHNNVNCQTLIDFQMQGNKQVFERMDGFESQLDKLCKTVESLASKIQLPHTPVPPPAPVPPPVPIRVISVAILKACFTTVMYIL